MRDAVLFTYDDHQAGTAFQNVSGQPNRIRCVRDERWKYAVYLDPSGAAAPEYELYDLEGDPDEERTSPTSTRDAAGPWPRSASAGASTAARGGVRRERHTHAALPP